MKPRSEGNSPGSKQSSGSGRTQEPKSPSDVSTVESSFLEGGDFFVTSDRPSDIAFMVIRICHASN